MLRAGAAAILHCIACLQVDAAQAATVCILALQHAGGAASVATYLQLIMVMRRSDTRHGRPARQ